MQLNVPMKSTMMSSHRNSKPKVEPIKIYKPQSQHSTVHHSRYQIFLHIEKWVLPALGPKLQQVAVKGISMKYMINLIKSQRNI